MQARRSPLVVCLLSFISAGCIDRARLNADCVWTADSPMPAEASGRENHLVVDVAVAEEVAIHSADIQQGKRSGHFVSNEVYVATREQCVASLFHRIAAVHGSNVVTLQSMRGRRPRGLDASVLATFAAAYVLVSLVFARRLKRRVAGWWLATAAPVLGVMVAAGGVLVFGLWAGVVEMFWVRDTHLSYRVERMPWQSQSLRLFAAAYLLFLVTALAICLPRRQPE